MHPDIEKLINIAKERDELTEEQKEVILRKAGQLGEDVDEIEFILEVFWGSSQKSHDVIKDRPDTNRSIMKLDKRDSRDKRGLFLKRDGKMSLGVCYWIANRFDIDPNVVRLSLISVEVFLIVLYIIRIVGLFLLIILLWILPTLYYYMYYYLLKSKESNNDMK